jgi:hypothetical protein
MFGVAGHKDGRELAGDGLFRRKGSFRRGRARKGALERAEQANEIERALQKGLF